MKKFLLRVIREMELIIAAINKMINRMKVLDDSRQEFVSSVASVKDAYYFNEGAGRFTSYAGRSAG